MAREFMLYVYNSADAKSAMTADIHWQFVKQCEVYIGRLKAEGRLLAAQSILDEGIFIENKGEVRFTRPIDQTGKVQVGCYHILAEGIGEPIEIAKQNPGFEWVLSATVEVRPIKTKELKTNFEYPR